MSKARVESIDALKSFRVSLIKFCESASVAMSDAEGDLNRMNSWLEHEMLNHWQGQIRSRHDALEKAKEALRMKKLYKDPSGARQNYMDEQKAVERANKRFEVAQAKLAVTRKWVQRFQKEAMMYQGQMQRMSSMVASELPAAGAKLSNMILQLEAYVGYGPAAAGSTVAGPAPLSAGSGGEDVSGGMARPAEEREKVAAGEEAKVADVEGDAHWGAGVAGASPAESRGENHP